MAQIFPYGLMPAPHLQLDPYNAPLGDGFMDPLMIERMRRLLPSVNRFRTPPARFSGRPPQPAMMPVSVSNELPYPQNPALAPQPQVMNPSMPTLGGPIPMPPVMNIPTTQPVAGPVPTGPASGGGFFDPKTQALFTLASGLLAQSGWQPQRVGLGEAFGKAGMQAVNTYQQARASEDERSLRALQRRKIESDIGAEERVRGDYANWQKLVSGLERADLTPYGGPRAPAAAPDGTLTAPAVDVNGRTPWDMLNAQADYLEDNLVGIKTPEVLKFAREEIKSMRDRAEKMEKLGTEAPKTRTISIGDINGKPHEQSQEWDRSAREWKNVGAPRPVFSDKPLVEMTLSDKGQQEHVKKFSAGIAEDDLAMRKAAVEASENVNKIDLILQHLQESEAITGMGAEIFNNVERARTLLMANEKAGKKVTDTELLDAMLGADVFPMIGQLGLGAKGLDTPAEREFLRKVMTGSITMNKQTLIRMAEIRRNVAARSIEKWNKRLPSLPKEAIEATGISSEPLQVPQAPLGPNSRSFQLDDGTSITGTLDPSTGRYYTIRGGKKFWIEE